MSIEQGTNQNDMNFKAPETGGKIESEDLPSDEEFLKAEREQTESQSPQELGNSFIEDQNRKFEKEHPNQKESSNWGTLVRSLGLMIVGVSIEKFGAHPYGGPQIDDPNIRLIVGGIITLVGVLASAKAGKLIWDEWKASKNTEESQVEND